MIDDGDQTHSMLWDMVRCYEGYRYEVYRIVEGIIGDDNTSRMIPKKTQNLTAMDVAWTGFARPGSTFGDDNTHNCFQYLCE